MNKYSEEQIMPTLKELSLSLKEDDEIYIDISTSRDSGIVHANSRIKTFSLTDNLEAYYIKEQR